MTLTPCQIQQQEEEQYKQVCAIDGCNEVLHINMPIHIWGKADPKSKYGFSNEMCICDHCHQDLENELHEEGWKHDEDDECDWF